MTADLAPAPFVKYDAETGDVVEHGVMPYSVILEKIEAGEPYVQAEGRFGRDRVNLKTKVVTEKSRRASPKRRKAK